MSGVQSDEHIRLDWGRMKWEKLLAKNGQEDTFFFVYR